MSRRRGQLAQAALLRAALKPCAEVYQFGCLAGTTLVTAQRVLRKSMAGALSPPTRLLLGKLNVVNQRTQRRLNSSLAHIVD
jgi:hypothetical protein